VSIFSTGGGSFSMPGFSPGDWLTREGATACRSFPHLLILPREEIGPRMLARIAKRTGLCAEDL
jgi:hypothetical protein